MAPDEFVRVLHQELARRGGRFDPADVRAFVEAAWPEVEKDRDPGRWARECTDSGRCDVLG